MGVVRMCAEVKEKKMVMQDQTTRRIFKILVMGDTGVGKTSLVYRSVKGKFPDPTLLKSTIGAAFSVKKITVDSDNGPIEVTLQIWDFAGQDQFRQLMVKLFKGAAGGLFVFDLTDPVTFDDLSSFWIPAVEGELNIDFSQSPEVAKNFILVGNKADMIKDRAIDYDEIKRVAKEKNFRYIVVSSKTGENVERLFNVLAKQLLVDYEKN